MFKDLIADLEGLAAPLAKSQAGDAGDANIQAAGATGGDSGDGGEGAAGAGAGEGAGEGDEEDDPSLAKSFEVELSNGTKFKAMDASDLIKSFAERMDAAESATGEALGLCVTMLKSLAADNARLTEAVGKLAATGSGRTSVLSIIGKNTAAAGSGATLTKSHASEGMKPQEFLAKSEAAFDAGKLTAREISLIETTINRGDQMPAALIQKVMSA